MATTVSTRGRTGPIDAALYLLYANGCPSLEGPPCPTTNGDNGDNVWQGQDMLMPPARCIMPLATSWLHPQPMAMMATMQGRTGHVDATCTCHIVPSGLCMSCPSWLCVSCPLWLPTSCHMFDDFSLLVFFANSLFCSSPVTMQHGGPLP